MPLFNLNQRNVHSIRKSLILLYLLNKKSTNLTKLQKSIIKAHLENIEKNLPVIPAWWERVKLNGKRRWIKCQRKLRNIF